MWAFDRLDKDRRLPLKNMVDPLSKWLFRSKPDVESQIRSVAGCDGRSPDLLPVRPYGEIRGYTRYVFAEYKGDPEAFLKGLICAARSLTGDPTVMGTIEGETGFDSKESEPSDPSSEEALNADQRGDEGAGPSMEPVLRWTIEAMPDSSTLPPLGWECRFPQALTNIKVFLDTLTSGRTTRPISGEDLQLLGNTAVELDRKTLGLRTPVPPDPQEAQRAFDIWVKHGKVLSALTARQIRILSQFPVCALDQAWIIGLLQVPHQYLRRSWLEYLLSSYLARWREFPNPTEFEANLGSLFLAYARNGPSAQKFVSRLTPLLGPDADVRLLQACADPLQVREDVLRTWALSPLTGLGKALLSQALRQWCNRWKLPFSRERELEYWNQLNQAATTLLDAPEIENELFMEAISSIILSEWPANALHLRERLIEICLHHPRLGDPRRQLANWVLAHEAQRRLISWMAQKDLKFFYDKVVSDRNDDQGRKAFWLNYVGSVADFQLVLNDEDGPRLKAELGKSLISHSRMDGRGKPSAFLLRFRSDSMREDIVCVEFSRSGNSLYVYDTSSFELGIGKMAAITFRIGSEPRNLKNREFIKCEPIPHQGNWQNRVNIYLHSLGVRRR